jgi:hypothetical protein
MKTLKIKTAILYICLFLITSISFATDDEEDEGTTPGTETVAEEECGFFCTIGEFFEDLF